MQQFLALSFNLAAVQCTQAAKITGYKNRNSNSLKIFALISVKRDMTCLEDSHLQSLLLEKTESFVTFIWSFLILANISTSQVFQ